MSVDTAKPAAPELLWRDDMHLRVRDVDFLVTADLGDLHGIESTTDCFVLGKTRAMVERMNDLGRQVDCRRILDIGIFKGGSVVLYDQLFRPDKLVAIEYAWPQVPALGDYIARRARHPAVRLCYGVNQADAAAMGQILADEFPARDLDLVVDDASHFYAETRASFNLVFPYLRPGGLYIIEDWAWAHWPGDYWQKENAYFGDKPALSNLVMECCLFGASRPDLVQEVVVRSDTIVITRGPARLPPGRFDLGQHYLLRGKTFRAWL